MALARVQWMSGCFMVGTCVLQSAFIAHRLPSIEDDPTKMIKTKASLENARLITLINGTGMCLLSLGKKKGPVALMASGMLVGATGLFSGGLWYQSICKDYSKGKFIMVGGTTTSLAWLAMMFA